MNMMMIVLVPFAQHLSILQTVKIRKTRSKLPIRLRGGASPDSPGDSHSTGGLSLGVIRKKRRICGSSSISRQFLSSSAHILVYALMRGSVHADKQFASAFRLLHSLCAFCLAPLRASAGEPTAGG
jgi:hypothetical protein